MEFKIRHEQKWIISALLICGLLYFLLLLSLLIGFPVWLLYVNTTAVTVLMLLYFLEQIVGTTVIVEADAVTIKYILCKRRIDTADICNLDIESYKRMRRRGGGAFYPDYRMRMTFTFSDVKKVVLTDKATKSGLALVNPEKLPDSEVPLYMAYTAICSIM